MTDGDLAGRTVLITGAGGGLGAAAAAAATAADARLILVDRHPDRLAALAERHGDAVLTTQSVDLADTAEVDALAAQLRTTTRVDAIWHLVGGWQGGQPIDAADATQWTQLHRSLVDSTVAMARAFAADLASVPTGRFVIVSSPMAQHPSTTNAAYGAAKAAAEATTLALAHHFRQAAAGATANIVVVPAIVTPSMRAEQPDRPWRVHVDSDDLARALVFVSSAAAAKMNGQRLNLFDGTPT